MKFIRMVLKTCDGKLIIILDRGGWYPYTLKRLGLNCIHKTFSDRNRVERFFRYLKDRTKRFYNNINIKSIASIADLVSAIAIIRKLIIELEQEV